MRESATAYPPTAGALPPPAATTDTALAALLGKSVRTASATSRTGVPAGSTRASERPSCSRPKGRPRLTSTPTTTTITGTGRRITAFARRYQNPCPDAGRAR